MNSKKFNADIEKLGELSRISQPLTAKELADIKQNILYSIAGTKPDIAGESVKPNFGRLINFATAILLGLSLAGGTVFASGSSVPGDFLYPVKLATEKMELDIAVSNKMKANLQNKFAHERLKELQKLVAKSSPTNSASSTQSSPSTNINSSISSNTPATSTGLIAPKQENANKNWNKYNSLAAKAKIDAEKQVNVALQAMEQEKQQLQNKGDKHDAENLNRNISELTTQAQAQNIYVNNEPVDSENSQTNNGKSKPQINLQIPDKNQGQFNKPGDNKLPSGTGEKADSQTPVEQNSQDVQKERQKSD